MNHKGDDWIAWLLWFICDMIDDVQESLFVVSLVFYQNKKEIE